MYTYSKNSSHKNPRRKTSSRICSATSSFVFGQRNSRQRSLCCLIFNLNWFSPLQLIIPAIPAGSWRMSRTPTSPQETGTKRETRTTAAIGDLADGIFGIIATSGLGGGTGEITTITTITTTTISSILLIHRRSSSKVITLRVHILQTSTIFTNRTRTGANNQEGDGFERSRCKITVTIPTSKIMVKLCRWVSNQYNQCNQCNNSQWHTNH